MPDQKTEVQKIEIEQLPEVQKLTPESIQQIAKFNPFAQQIDEWKAKAFALVVTSEDQVDDMKKARDARLAVRAIRIAAENLRKEMKSESLLFGKAVDAASKLIQEPIKDIEAHLKIQEDFKKVAEAKRKQELIEGRKAIIEARGLNQFVPAFPFADMSDQDFASFLEVGENNKKAHIEEQERKAKEAAEKAAILADEQKKLAEIERQKKLAEAERRAKEKAEMDAKIQANKAKAAEENQRKAEQAAKEAEAKAKADREAKEKLEIQIKQQEEQAKAEKEARAKAEAEKKAKADAMGDMEKIAAYIAAIEAVEKPILQDEGMLNLLSQINTGIQNIATFARKKLT